MSIDPVDAESGASADTRQKGRGSWVLAGILLVVVVLGGGFLVAMHHAMRRAETAPRGVSSAASDVPPTAVRTLMGSGRRTYVDHDGNTWTPGTNCNGGSSDVVPEQKIAGTKDPYLYLGGIRGTAHCIFPVKPGTYEVHFYFSRPSGLRMSSRLATVSVNAEPDTGFNVDDADGKDVAAPRVLTEVHPEIDGSIHVNVVSEGSLLNAIEILPAP